jgi:hypothetical protein
MSRKSVRFVPPSPVVVSLPMHTKRGPALFQILQSQLPHGRSGSEPATRKNHCGSDIKACWRHFVRLFYTDVGGGFFHQNRIDGRLAARAAAELCRCPPERVNTSCGWGGWSRSEAAGADEQSGRKWVARLRCERNPVIEEYPGQSPY